MARVDIFVFRQTKLLPEFMGNSKRENENEYDGHEYFFFFLLRE